MTAAPTLRIRRKSRWRGTLLRLAGFAAALLLFALALFLIREGVTPIGDRLRQVFPFDSPARALGFGWLSSSLVLSGSPVAATALSFHDAGILDPSQTFAMIAGSRLGAAFIVLVVGFIHLLRGRHRMLSLGAGLLSLLVTQTTYLFVLPLGLLMLNQGWLATQWSLAVDVASPFELLLDPIVNTVKAWLPLWFLFVIGFVLLLATFRLFDRLLPDLHLERSRASGLNRLLYRPEVSFLLGALITTLTFSVSVSLSLLVPLSARGYIRQENIIPYIMGANITTFDDTLIAAALLGKPTGVTVVIVQMISVAVVSLVILLLAYRTYQRLLVWLASTIGKRPLTLAAYLVAMFLLPLILMFGGFR